ncbi:YihY family inner membrane protein [Aquabacterium sp. OR-4]|uniref:YihY family inner membrane protein n=1 Tax=Aquabacterium sp. OR-4 TaxID=2978127 RepID=UPI0021B4191D|nr:YihY family inner membrane protein [Aquabacterium sp. OR-4]MDT7835976.1 YihY family inner membrane protein [Aquabacterium sp. OR-4]
MTSIPRPAAAGRQRLAQLAHALRHWPWFDTLRTLRLRFRDDRLGLTAGSLTFTTLIGLVPLMTVMLAVFSAFPMFGRFQTALQQYFLQSLVPDGIARPVLQALTQFAAKASKVGSLGLLLFGLTALLLVFTIDRTLNAIWRVRKPRPLAQRVLVYWAVLTLGPLVLGASLSLTSYAISASRGVVNALPGGLELLLDALQFTLLAAGMCGLFRFVPNVSVRWGHALAGGLFVAVGIELAKAVLAWYVTRVATFSAVYGAFATVPILLLWIYLGWVIVLLGAVIAAYAPTLTIHAPRRPERPGEPFALAIALLRRLALAQREGAAGLRGLALAAQVRTDPLQVNQVLETLRSLDWCGLLEEEGDPRWVLLVTPERTPALPLVDALLLGEADDSLAFRQQAGLAQLRLGELLR